MAHDHRMNEVGEPHLNKVNRGSGRSYLPRLRGMLTNQLADEHRHVNQWADMRGTAASPISGNSVIEPNLTPAIAEAVDARITNYREDRNFAKRTNMPQSSLSRDTAREVGARFSRRQYFGDGDWA